MTQDSNAYLTGQLLLAMPCMSDPRFHKSVILVCQHDSKGAIGVTLNSVLPTLKFGALLAQFDVDIEPEMKDPLMRMPVFGGGPVDTERGFLIHSGDFITNDTTSLNQDVSLSTTLAALKAVARGQGPKHRKFALGYAGWTDGQLEREIQENSWLTAPATHTLIFETDPDLLWESTMSSIGVAPSMLSHMAGQA